MNIPSTRVTDSGRALPYANIVKGRVEIKGTRAGVTGLIVRLYDVVKPGSVAQDGGGPPKDQIRRALGSTITSNGVFEIRYDDELFRTDRAEGARPDLLIAVSASEQKTVGGVTQLLFESEVRQSGAREECFLIHIELSELKKRGVLLPSVVDGLVSDPKEAGIAANQERDRWVSLREQVNEVRKKAVIEARKFEEDADRELRDRVMQNLTGLTSDMPQWKRFVGPGEDAQKVVRENQKDAITKVINKQANKGAETYLVLSAEELDALGTPPTADAIEQLLRRRNPTPSLLREDPVLLACHHRSNENPFDSTPNSPSVSPPRISPTPAANVDGKVLELVRSISIPENEPGNGGRPDQNVVANNVKTLNLSKGPADVPAFYDFHNLQIAFEHVWEDARADGVLERTKAMYRLVSDGGGDARFALRNSTDPIRGLLKEAKIVQQAQARFGAPRVSWSSSSREMPVLHMEQRPEPYGEHEEVFAPPFDPTTPPLPAPDGSPDPNFGSEAVSVGGYPFSLFADRSTNFGILVTYRQRWESMNYQVGRLVSTQTLAPKETISVVTRQVIKTSLNRKQMESSQQTRKEDDEATQRDEAEIVNRAQAQSNFATSAQGGWSLGPFGGGSFTAGFGKDAERNSQETKKAFRESVRSAAQEYRDERRLELETAQSTETEITQKRDISNPNDELLLTYIFYELQRRYRISERLHRIVPVVLVGQYVPRPEEITSGWLVRHDWIIRRFLPDDTFRSALVYLATQAQGDSVVLQQLLSQKLAIETAVASLNGQIQIQRDEAAEQDQAIGAYIRAKADKENQEWFWYYKNAATDSSQESLDALRILEEAARERFEKAAREEKDLRARLDREVTALQSATDAYVRAYAEHSNQTHQVNRLIRHVKDNILYYMQGIWSYEHSDQRFLRHHAILAPRLEATQRSYTLTEVDELPIGVVPQPGKKCYRVTFTTQIDEDLESSEKSATLAELADLDRPLGFKGNYIIYPLKKSNALTDFMLTPYLDADLGLRDPDAIGNWTLQEFSDYVQCLRSKLGEGFAEVEGHLRKHYQELLADPIRDGEEVIVPTNALYMQMLVDPGKALEEFKAAHRFYDVMKVKAEVVSSELDNLRRAKLVLDNQLEDPNVEAVKNVYYRGTTPPHDGDE